MSMGIVCTESLQVSHIGASMHQACQIKAVGIGDIIGENMCGRGEKRTRNSIMTVLTVTTYRGQRRYADNVV